MKICKQNGLLFLEATIMFQNINIKKNSLVLCTIRDNGRFQQNAFPQHKKFRVSQWVQVISYTKNLKKYLEGKNKLKCTALKIVFK